MKPQSPFVHCPAIHQIVLIVIHSSYSHTAQCHQTSTTHMPAVISVLIVMGYQADTLLTPTESTHYLLLGQSLLATTPHLVHFRLK